MIEKTPLSLFIPVSTGNASASGFRGEPLAEIKFDTVSEMSDFVKEHDGVVEIHGQTSPAHQYINQRWSDEIRFEMKNIRVLNFDIEVSSVDGKFPYPDKALAEITSIAMKVFGDSNRYVFGLKDYTPKKDTDHYIRCRDEKHLLISFIEHWKRINPDIITGWYVDGFDIPYLINRITKVLGEEWAIQLSPFYKETKRVFKEKRLGRDVSGYEILGITTYDYQDLYKKFSTEKLESYKLNSVGEHENVGQKVDWESKGFKSLDDLYERDFELFIDYNLQDVELVEAIDRKLKFILAAVNIAYLTHSRLGEALGTVKPWDNFIYNMLSRSGTVIPPVESASKDHEIVGAFVKVPVPKKYHWVVSMDMTSLYPSIVMMLNMSPETIEDTSVKSPMEFMKKILSGDPETLQLLESRTEKGLCVAANGSSYHQDKVGVIPRGMKTLFDTRKLVKNVEMKKAKKSLEAAKKNGEDTTHLREKVQQLDAYQQALKVVANGGYGAASNVGFRYFNLSIAEGITITGQLCIMYAAQELNRFLNKRFKTDGLDYVCYIDTDSSYLNLEPFVANILKVPKDQWETKASKIVDAIDAFVKKEIDPMLQDAWVRFVKMLGSVNNTMDMKREAIASSIIFRGRKNYIYRVWDNEGVRFAEPMIKSVGVEAKKTSTPLVIRNALKGCYEIMLKENEETRLQKYVGEVKSEYSTLSGKEIAFPRGVSELRKFMTNDELRFQKGAPIHARAAIIFNEKVKQHNLETKYGLIEEGGKLRFVYLKEPNPLRSNVIGFIDELPTEFGVDKYIDRDLQYSKSFLEPLQSFTSIIGWEIEKRESLDDLWS